MQENTVREFLNEVFGEVRAFEENGQIWFVASDVAKVLEYSSTQKVTEKIDKEDYRTSLTLTKGGKQEMIVINESGLYQTVTSITKKNKKRYEKAREFKRWICGTVIPALRKDGIYVDKEENVVSGELSEDELILKAMTCLQSKVERLKADNEKLQKDNDRYSKLIGDKRGRVSKTELAKRLNTSPQRLSKILKEQNIYTPKTNDISQWFLDKNKDINITVVENNTYTDKDGREHNSTSWQYSNDGAIRVVKFLEDKGIIKYSDNEGFVLK